MTPVEALGKKDAGFWAQGEGRKALRFLASLACTQNRRRIVSYLVLEHNVHLAPSDEVALDKGYPRRQKSNRDTTPLQASTLTKNENLVLYVLSLRPEADLDLGRVIFDDDSNTLHNAAQAGMSRLIEELLRRSDAPLLDRKADGHTIACIWALTCNPALLRICLETHRIQGTLHQALEPPCGGKDECGKAFRQPLLHHVITSTLPRDTAEAQLATARLLVKEYRADAIAQYPGKAKTTPLISAESNEKKKKGKDKKKGKEGKSAAVASVTTALDCLILREEAEDEKTGVQLPSQRKMGKKQV